MRSQSEFRDARFDVMELVLWSCRQKVSQDATGTQFEHGKTLRGTGASDVGDINWCVCTGQSGMRRRL